MPITATPFDLRDLVVPDDLAEILQKGGRDKTPVYDTVLSKHRKLVSGLRRQVWPVASTVEPAPEAEPEPEAAPEEAPTPADPGVGSEPADVPAEEPAAPESDPEG
jgi:hypothetical protein